jgi:hypothetical protein
VVLQGGLDGDIHAWSVAKRMCAIAFLITALDRLSLKACYIQNVYLNVDCQEKICMLARPEFRVGMHHAGEESSV